MLKIHPGFKAIAILMGPAAVIIGYHNLSKYLSPPTPYDPQVFKLMQQVYRKCSEPPKLQRTVQCDEYVSYFDGCIRAKYKCNLSSAHEMLVKLEFDPPPLRLSPIDKVAVTDATER